MPTWGDFHPDARETLQQFRTPESRRPIWRFPNEFPIAAEPADVYATLETAHQAPAQWSYPKLLFTASPGALVSAAVARRFANNIEDCKVIALGEGIPYLQEDHAEVIGSSVRDWLIQLGDMPVQSTVDAPGNHFSACYGQCGAGERARHAIGRSVIPPVSGP